MEDIFLSEAIHNILFIFILFALQCFLASRKPKMVGLFITVVVFFAVV